MKLELLKDVHHPQVLHLYKALLILVIVFFQLLQYRYYRCINVAEIECG